MLASVIPLCFALSLCILPYYLWPGSLGVDHWFWKNYIEAYRRERLFPPVLPQYLLDEHQWYPPLSPLVMAHLPSVIFERYSYFVAILIDLLQMVLLLCVVSWLSGGNPHAVAIAGLAYGATPILVSYNIQLNPRGLGALFLDGLIVLLLWWYFFDGPVWVWAVVLVLAGLILLTHKMTTQVFLVSMPWGRIDNNGLAGSCIDSWFNPDRAPDEQGILPEGFTCPLGCRYFLEQKYWRWLQAHPIKESSIYGVLNFETPTKFHRTGCGLMLDWWSALHSRPANVLWHQGRWPNRCGLLCSRHHIALPATARQLGCSPGYSRFRYHTFYSLFEAKRILRDIRFWPYPISSFTRQETTHILPCTIA